MILVIRAVLPIQSNKGHQIVVVVVNGVVRVIGVRCFCFVMRHIVVETTHYPLVCQPSRGWTVLSIDEVFEFCLPIDVFWEFTPWTMHDYGVASIVIGHGVLWVAVDTGEIRDYDFSVLAFFD